VAVVALGACLLVSGCGGASTSRQTTTIRPTTTTSRPRIVNGLRITGLTTTTSRERVFQMPSSSMEPTIHCAKPAPGCRGKTDDLVVVLPGKAVYRGAVLVFRAPREAAMECGEGGVFVKRLIGLPGETVHEDDKGFIDIDGKRLAEPYVSVPSRLADSGHFGGTWHVAKGGYFVLGDNRAASCDSRTWGSVPSRNIIGPVERIMRPR
jgi:signal peptidase I